MASEEIIQRLLDEKKITVKEAMVILKDLAKIGLQQILPEKIFPDTWREEPIKKPYDVVVMYGVTTNPWYDTTTISEHASATTISNDIEDLTKDNRKKC